MSDEDERHPHFCECSACMNRGGGEPATMTRTTMDPPEPPPLLLGNEPGTAREHHLKEGARKRHLNRERAALMRLPQRLASPVGLGAMGPIIYAVAEAFGVSVRDLRGDGKSRVLGDARACAYLVGRRCTSFSYSELGTAFGHRHHTTIMSGEKLAGGLVRKDSAFAATVRGLVERFSSGQKAAS